MNFRMSALAVFAGLLPMTVAVRADDAPVFSGPQPGEKITSFKVLGVYDDEKEQEYDFVHMASDNPFMLIFVHSPTRPAGDLARALLHYADMRKEDELFSALVYLTDDITESERKMVQAYGWWNCGPPSGISVDGAEGPGAYGLNRNVTMTILIGKDRRVTANHALIQPSDSDTARIVPSITKLIGGDVPTVPEVEFLRSPSRLPPIARFREGGKTPTDAKLRSLMCRLIREHDEAAKTATTIDEIRTHVDGHPELESELGETSRLVLTRTYGSRPPIIELVPDLTQPFQDWEKMYFNPSVSIGN